MIREVETPRTRVNGWDIVLGLVVGTALAHLVAGCCATRPPIKIVTEVRACIEAPRPPRPVIWFAGSIEGCPDAWEACLTLDAASSLDRYITQMERWSDLTWIACGPQETP